jgi:putative redox protein
MRSVAVKWAKGKFAQDIEIAGHKIRSDEVAEKGGDDTGATPHELLLAALGSCTAMTLKVYAERKGWPLRDVHVTLNGTNGEGAYIITRQVAIDGDLDAEQRQRLMEIADKCPVHRTLMGEITIKTTAGDV